MFAKLKKKVEDLEGSDLHKLANSISFSNVTGGPEKSASSNSIKSHDNFVASSQSQKGSTTSLSSMQGGIRPDEADATIATDKKWKQRLVEIENEWRVKVMVQEHEKEQIAKDRDLLNQQKRKMEEEIKELKGYQDKCLKAEESLKQMQESNKRESASLQLLLSNASVEVEDMKVKDDQLHKELIKKDEMIKMLQVQIRLNEEMYQNSKKSDLEGSSQEPQVDRLEHENLQKQLQLKHEERLKTLEESLIAKDCELQRLQRHLDQGKTALDTMTQNWQEEKTHNLSLKDRIAQLSEEKDHFVVRNAELSQQVSLSQQQLQRTERELYELQDKFCNTEKENQQIKLLLADAEARDENSERTCKLRSQIAELEAAFSEKNKTIKLQQQRLADMKKTLQKELKNQNNDPDCLSVPTSLPIAPKSPILSQAPQSAKSEMEEVNFKYLKHVIFKFLTSREYEAQHLTRAVSTLLKLTQDEEKLLKETLEWKMSWFRSRPDLGTGQGAMYIPPTH